MDREQVLWLVLLLVAAFGFVTFLLIVQRALVRGL